MALTSDQITALNFKKFYEVIRPYLNGATHAGYTPVGTVISVMGKTAPENYLICNGSVYNIGDYPELANYFADQFGSASYFGGNGTTTFAVPDLRGEFLRGTGTNSHTNQGNGAAVGTHQDATEVPYIGVNTTSTYCLWTSSIGQSSTSSHGIQPVKTDSGIPGSNTTSTNGYQGAVNSIKSTWAGAGNLSNYTTRPTNTAVLYCIATKNIYIDAKYDFSLGETVIGKWVDGKTLYQKSFVRTTGAVSTDVQVGTISNVGQVTATFGSITRSNGRMDSMPSTANAIAVSTAGVVTVYTTNNNQVNRPCVVTIQYTKSE